MPLPPADSVAALMMADAKAVPVASAVTFYKSLATRCLAAVQGGNGISGAIVPLPTAAVVATQVEADTKSKGASEVYSAIVGELFKPLSTPGCVALPSGVITISTPPATVAQAIAAAVKATDPKALAFYTSLATRFFAAVQLGLVDPNTGAIA